jgi:23S rRNA (guanine745-N1)-methyltransferase
VAGALPAGRPGVRRTSPGPLSRRLRSTPPSEGPLAVPVHDRLPPRVVAALRCPHCAGGLELVGRALTCPRSHAFDVARQGHVDLRGPRGSRGAGDDTRMVARRLAVLRAGHLDPLLHALTDAIARAEASRPLPDGLIVDVGAGPGAQLAAVLAAFPDRHGLAVDVSRAAAQRAALAHPRAGAVIADVWHGLPLAAGSAALVLDVFAPRHGGEFRRILDPEGRLVVVTPQVDHLAALLAVLSPVSVDPDKDRRLSETLGADLELVDRFERRWHLEVDRDTAADLAGMGPGGHVLTADELAARAATLPATFDAEAAVVVSVYRPRRRAAADGEQQEAP